MPAKIANTDNTRTEKSILKGLRDGLLHYTALLGF
jgi:hypothetical protein